jgi:hypothetical protein
MKRDFSGLLKMPCNLLHLSGVPKSQQKSQIFLSKDGKDALNRN